MFNYESTLTCPVCGHQQRQYIPVENLDSYYCSACESMIGKLEGTCCIYCSYGTNKCLMEQGWRLLETKLYQESIMKSNERQSRYKPALGFDWLTMWYDLAIKVTMPERKFRTQLVEQLAPQPGERILEFGFGTGTNLDLAISKEHNAYYYGLDVDPKVRMIAYKKLKKYQEKVFLELDLYEGTTFPYSDDSFDKVYSCLVFHHLDKLAKQQALTEILRVLKPGGQLIIADWGKPKTMIMRFAFYAVQMLDGFKTTKDNVDGKLPEFMEKGGFGSVKEVDFINTGIGSLCYYEGIKLRFG